jgi:small nuclear ribonucleoprotein (snRNP)-like protein
MSSKQLAHSVKDGKKITVSLSGQQVISGYLCGMDDYNLMLITSEADKALVHKTGAIIFLSDEPTYPEEPQHEALEQVVGPFRRHIEETYFSSRGAPASERTSA